MVSPFIYYPDVQYIVHYICMCIYCADVQLNVFLLSVEVAAYLPKPSGKRNYSKMNICYFCERKVKSAISKHYLAVHPNQELVKDIINASGKPRRTLLYKLQQLGNFHHNCKVTYFHIIFIISKFSQIYSGAISGHVKLYTSILCPYSPTCT